MWSTEREPGPPFEGFGPTTWIQDPALESGSTITIPGLLLTMLVYQCHRRTNNSERKTTTKAA